MTTVDWSRPIEAVHEDGRVVAVSTVSKGRWSPVDADYEVRPAVGGWGSYQADGSPYSSGNPWRIRNTPAAEPVGNTDALPPELQQRMVALVRGMAGVGGAMVTVDGAGYQQAKAAVSRRIDEARAIVADPGFPAEVDEDLVEAREIVAEMYASTSDVAAAIRRGTEFECRVEDVKRGIRRGKQLAGEA